MKLYAKINSDRASKGQGGNKYLATEYYIVDREKPQAKVEIINDKEKGEIHFVVKEYFFGKWTEKYHNIYYINIEKTKGKRQKGENTSHCGECGEPFQHSSQCSKA